MFYVYVIYSKKVNKRYVGQTSDLQRRLFAHNSDDSRYTKNKGPWTLIHQEQYQTRSQAIVREKFLKTGKGRDFLDNLTQ